MGSQEFLFISVSGEGLAGCDFFELRRDFGLCGRTNALTIFLSGFLNVRPIFFGISGRLNMEVDGFRRWSNIELARDFILD